MKIFIEQNQKNKKIEFKGTVGELLLKLNINSETVLVTKNNELVTEDEVLKDSDEIKVLSVVSGG